VCVYPGFMRSVLFLLLMGCGAAPNQPLLANAPRPNTGAVAGAAAAVAGAATLAAPDYAAKNAAEANKPAPDNKGQKSGGIVPPDVFDRLDEKQKKPAAPDQQPAAPSGEP
jgi:hypothetical protein